MPKSYLTEFNTLLFNTLLTFALLTFALLSFALLSNAPLKQYQRLFKIRIFRWVIVLRVNSAQIASKCFSVASYKSTPMQMLDSQSTSVLKG